MNETTSNSPNGIGAISFTPILAANVAFAVMFSNVLFIQVILTARFWHYYGYAVGMLGGLLLEVLGCVAKAKLSHNPGDKDSYIMYIIGLTLGPTFLSSSLYLSISTLQRSFRCAKFKHISPRLFSTLFILGDFICLCFIGVGGSLAAIYAWSPIGVDLMIVGLASQVLWTTIFCVLLLVIHRQIKSVVAGDRRRYHMLGTMVAATCLFIRSCWRVAELSGGFNGPLASKEGVFIALDSVPMVIMSILLTVFHPGLWFVGYFAEIRQPEYEFKGLVRAP